MMLSDISKSITEMTIEELRQRIIDVRAARRTSRPMAKPKKATSPKAAKAGKKDLTLDDLTPTQLDQLLAALGGKT